MTTLPIESVLGEVREALGTHGQAVLVAPPGAGKTTRVPPALLDEPWLKAGRIVLLEPRRLAARAAAGRMADVMGEPVGHTVGYRMRLETRVSAATRIEVVTEGVLTRMLQTDPALEGVGLIIFDEFHERSLQADLGLALCLQSRELLREDLRVLVMSATLEAEPIAGLMGDAPVVRSEGRSFPVETHYLPHRVEGRIEPAVAGAIRRAMASHEGDVLVFLPGAGEIRRTEALLEGLPGARVLPLYGDLPRAAQDEAIRPGRPDARKVVLATSIAETSLTIEGVRVVVDSGLMRVPRFSPRSGMTRLETRRVTRANAAQRRGRAGRTAPGVCYRLWTRHDHEHLARHTLPEILEVDLAGLVLELACWGVSDPGELRWLDAPPAPAWEQAVELLKFLEALDERGAVTVHGRAMAALGTHPRLAHALLRSVDLGIAATACRTVALLSERDIFRTTGEAPDVDLRLRLETVEAVQRGRRTQADEGACRRVLLEERHYRRRLHVNDAAVDPDVCGLVVALAYPDRVAQRRSAGRFSLRNGRTVVLPGNQPLADTPWLAVADLDGQTGESRAFLAAPIAVEDIEQLFAGQLVREDVVRWDDASDRLVARRQIRLGALILRQGALAEIDAEQRTAAVVDMIRRKGLNWSEEARGLRDRIRFAASLEAGWPDVSDEALMASLEEWLGPFVTGVRSREDLERIDLAEALSMLLPWDQRRRLDELAPTHFTVPTGSRIRIDYSDPARPVLAVRLQEMFGMAETPRIGGGRVALTLHLLSPAHRPVQVTQDLAGFWKNSYFDVRKDLRGRYPKHYWPDDPLMAEPTRRSKR